MNAPYKGTGPKDAKYAQGGAVCTSRSRFMKVPDTFRTDIQKTDYGKNGRKNYSKGGPVLKEIYGAMDAEKDVEEKKDRVFSDRAGNAEDPYPTQQEILPPETGDRNIMRPGRGGSTEEEI